MKKNILFITLFILSSTLFGQKEYNVWRMGSRSGLDFNSTTPGVFSGPTSFNATTGGAIASICNSNGQLLFYSNGKDVYNANNTITLNGSGLALVGDDNICQGVLIVPHPGNPSKYYIFRLSALGNSNLAYSIFDMTLDGGLGDIPFGAKRIIFTPSNLTEKLTAVRHANGIDIWIIVHEIGNNKYLSYLLTSNGFDVNQTPVVSAIGLVPVSGWLGGNGYLKANLNGTKIVNADNGNKVWQLFDFNKSTGVLSNPLTLLPFTGQEVYGAEFSPNGKVLYGSSPGSGTLQWDISSGDSATINASRNLVGRSMYALQLGPDGRIYVSRGLEAYYPRPVSLDVINHPNCYGVNSSGDTLCNYVNNGVIFSGGGPELDITNNPLNIFPFILPHGPLDCDSISIEPTLTISNTFLQNDADPVLIYPNPFNDNTTFEISLPNLKPNYTFELTDLMGKKVKVISGINEKQFQLSRVGIENGIYFYKIVASESVIGIGKVVIK